MRHYNIPIFVPHEGCPHDCAFCNQKKITGKTHAPSGREAAELIAQSLSTMKKEERQVEAAFFGGSFTAIPISYQEELLAAAYPFVKSGELTGIRLSTRPDAVTEEGISLLLRYGVTAVELGAQSMDHDVLRASRRGHTAEDTARAAKLIRRHGLSLGLQMMTGLPEDTHEKDMETARRLIVLSPDCVRIYPTLVLRGTELYARYQAGEYRPQELSEAVETAAALYGLFCENHIPVIRMGLMASDEICENGGAVAAGPFHSAFGELVQSRIMLERMKDMGEEQDGMIHIRVNPRDLSRAAGNRKQNLILLREYFQKDVRLMPDERCPMAFGMKR